MTDFSAFGPAPDTDRASPAPAPKRAAGKSNKALGNSTGQLRVEKQSMLTMGIRVKGEFSGQKQWAGKLKKAVHLARESITAGGSGQTIQ